MARIKVLFGSDSYLSICDIYYQGVTPISAHAKSRGATTKVTSTMPIVFIIYFPSFD